MRRPTPAALAMRELCGIGMSNSDEDSQVMFLTGCASGIGRHVAGRLAAAGHRLMLTDIDLAALEQAAAAEVWQLDRAVLRQLDVRSSDGWQHLWQETVDRFGPVDVLWNIAGYLRPGYVHQSLADQVD